LSRKDINNLKKENQELKIKINNYKLDEYKIKMLNEKVTKLQNEISDMK